jgi:hypothetical protein
MFFFIVLKKTKRLRIFEHRILRKIFGPVQNEDGSWRIRMNYELNKLTENADIVRFIKSRRTAWLGHVMRMDDKRTAKRISEWKHTGTRIRVRPRKRWILDIEEDMYEGNSNEHLKIAIKIQNTARLSCKLTIMILMV